MRRTIFLILFTICHLGLMAQVGVEARIDSIEMLIGQQAHITVSATAASSAKVEFPAFQPRQMLTEGVEVVGSSHDTTEQLDNNMTRRSRIYTVTSFDGKLYYLPPFKVKINGKVYPTKNLALKVLEVEVDTTQVDKFFGPKDVQDNPFAWNEWAPLFWLSVLMLVLMALGGYLYMRLRDNKPIIKVITITKRLLPHQKAMKEIEEIKTAKLYVNEDATKEYYTRLTDTLRKYIEERYGFSAMEMTSSEIIERLTAGNDQKALDELRQLLTTADLVKFAKYSTLINENDMNLVNAIEFINQTKQENPPAEEVQKPQLSAEDQRSVKTRRLLKGLISGIAIVCILIFIYVVISLFNLL